jgi:hypothetical protein
MYLDIYTVCVLTRCIDVLNVLVAPAVAAVGVVIKLLLICSRAEVSDNPILRIIIHI